ncbi:MAG: hypothetical protein EA359_14935 [Balneolaceae bacterium]|nr:MAG: hypothetical protein EA359_14935 [Balneolaceae bacterium]
MDFLIYAGGEEPYCEFAGNINDLTLPDQQQEELKLILESDTPTILLLVQGRPRLITGILDKTDAVLHCGLPGFEGAEAIANVISGKVNPSGKLPFSYPMHPHHILPYNHKKSNLYFYDSEKANHIIQTDDSPSLFPFGYGLSYTCFTYSSLKLSSESMTPDGRISARLTVTNSGEREGTETVLWFISVNVGRITRPVKELKHFEKVSLKPGESAVLYFNIISDLLSYPDEDGNPVLEQCDCSVMAGNQKTGFSIHLE